MSEVSLAPSEIEFLLSPAAIRERARDVFELCERGGTAFLYRPEKLKPTIDFVLEVIRRNYPDLKIPFHSRWGHFRAGGIDRAASLKARLASIEGTAAGGAAEAAMERARIKLDLVITSVLLDAGAGDAWKYVEAESGKTFARSEGLGVASWHMFLDGAMSADRKSPRADAAGLQSVTPDDIRRHFQVTKDNPLVGVEGRARLLNNLGRAVADSKVIPGGRPGGILDRVAAQAKDGVISAPVILRAVLEGFGSIWPGRLTANGTNLGDVWRHSTLGPASSSKSLVPLHKLSQWMTYSLIEPIQEAGFTVANVDRLTGLAEYRNGGLLIDSGLLEPRDPATLAKSWAPGSDTVIEWRALTVHLLDRIGEGVQTALGRTPADFPLAKVLEGGTWWAGRELAKKRPGGGPPLNIESDGTVF